MLAALGQLCCDITPYKLLPSAAAQQCSGVLSETRLIRFSHDLLEHTLLQNFHARRHGLEPLEEEAELATEEQRLVDVDVMLEPPIGWHRSHQGHNYLDLSRYDRQFEDFKLCFPREQFFVTQ